MTDVIWKNRYSRNWCLNVNNGQNCQNSQISTCCIFHIFKLDCLLSWMIAYFTMTTQLMNTIISLTNAVLKSIVLCQNLTVLTLNVWIVRSALYHLATPAPPRNTYNYNLVTHFTWMTQNYWHSYACFLLFNVWNWFSF